MSELFQARYDNFNKPIPWDNIFAGVDKLKAKWAAHANPASRLQAIEAVERGTILTHGGLPSSIPGPGGQPVAVSSLDTSTLRAMMKGKTLPGTQAQAMKKMTYEGLREGGKNVFAEGAHPALTARTEREIASALREEVAQAYGIGELNRREGGLLELEKAIRSYVAREGNKQITGYFGPILAGMTGIGAGAGYGTHAGLGAGLGVLALSMARNALEDPAVKSALAITLHRAGKNVPASLLKGLGTVVPAIPAAGIRIGAAELTPPPPR